MIAEETSGSPVGAFIRSVPKVELHVHLVGSASPVVVAELARRHPEAGVPTDHAALASWFDFTDFAHFIEVYNRVSSLVRSGEDVATLVQGAASELARQQVRYVEMTVTPYTHVTAGLEHDDLVAGLDAGREVARRLGVEVAWVYDIPGVRGRDAARLTVELATEQPPDGLVGFGLGGAESGVPRSDFAWAFDVARAAGLRSVPHAGEDDGPASIRAALDDLGADRIGHGVRVVEDRELLRRVVEERVPLEVCPSSNVCTGVYPSLDAHPLPDLLDADAVVTINTDDPPMFSTTLNEEYERIAATLSLGVAEVELLVRNGVDASFLDPSRRAAIHAEIDQAVLEHRS